MSTKNLSRTVIEGGRAHGNRWERRDSNAQARTHTRQLSRELCRARELDDVVYAPRRAVPRQFHDKLAPAERWLHSQVGRPWNKVRGELVARFDARTTAGRHVLFDHLLPDVEESSPWRRPKFRVDRRGILKRTPPRRRAGYCVPDPLSEPQDELERWLRGRAIGNVGVALYWFVPTRLGRLRQDRRLAPDEVRRWLALPGWFRREHDPRVQLARQEAACPAR